MESIGDFAESLIQGEVRDISEGKVTPPSMNTNKPAAAPAGKDIRGTQVPDSMMKEILGEAFHPQETPSIEAIPELVWADSEEEEVVQKPTLIAEERVDELINLLREVKDLLSEMTVAGTSSGQIGVNLGGPTKGRKVKTQKGYAPSLKPTLPSNFKSSRALIRQAISSRQRKRR
jgi:hypothetical protein